MLKDGLLDCSYTQSEIDLCLFCRDNLIIVAYTGNYIIFAKDYTKVKGIIKSLKTNFTLTDEGDLSTYLEIDINKNNNGLWSLS